MYHLIMAFIFSMFFLSLHASEVTQSHGSVQIAPFKKVVLVLFENENFDKPLMHPFFSKLAHEGALLTNYHAVAHPSQPNYIALTSGDTQGVSDDRNHDLDVRNIGDLLEEKGKNWKNYAEDFPGKCFLGERDGAYTRKHTPFISYKKIFTTERCGNVVNATQFEKDLKNKTLPDFSFYTPNMDDDAHDTDMAYGERWFAKKFSPLIARPEFKDVLLIVTFDENECATVGHWVTAEKRAACKGDSNQVYTVFYGRGIKAGSSSDGLYNHYSLLRTIEAGFGLGTLGKQDEKAAVISGIWENTAPAPSENQKRVRP